MGWKGVCVAKTEKASSGVWATLYKITGVLVVGKPVKCCALEEGKSNEKKKR